MKRLTIILLLGLATILATPLAQADAAGMAVRVDEKLVPFPVFALFPLPGQSLQIETRYPEFSAGNAVVSAEQGTLTALPNRSWLWRAPEEPGLVVISIIDRDTGKQVTLNAFVLTPADHDSRSLKGYRIGHYESRPLRGLSAYRRPDGFVQVDRAQGPVLVSPNFRIEQFLCKQADGPPEFLLVEQRLLIKLEAILAEVQARGFKADTLHVMSGYRTPWYNRSIGNKTNYSRHLYGDAADIFVDADKDGMMDDLNGDGRITRADAEYLADLIQTTVDKSGDSSLVGGMGIYGPAPHRGPFVHVDVRGYKARW